MFTVLNCHLLFGCRLEKHNLLFLLFLWSVGRLQWLHSWIRNLLGVRNISGRKVKGKSKQAGTQKQGRWLAVPGGHQVIHIFFRQIKKMFLKLRSAGLEIPVTETTACSYTFQSLPQPLLLQVAFY